MSARPAKADQFAISPIVTFGVFAAVNLLAALYAPISDCDETFNYWEPTHYLSHGYGLQTWEYSPEFAIRSWTYITLHAVVGQLGYFITFSKVKEFYWLRIVLALACAYCQTKLSTTISKVLNPRVAIMFMIVMVSSPGMFSASVAYLPSSFSMYANMLGATAFMNWRGGSGTATGIMWFAIGGVIGWPFASALVAPFLFEEFAFVWTTGEWIELVRRLLDGAFRVLIMVVLQIFIEMFFYHKTVVVPWNIVAYNVFSGSGKGPDIFGTEPFDFYFRNLLLNFNVWMPLALSAAPVLLLHFAFGRQLTAFKLFRSLVFVAPFYMWLAIFSLQAHKEERFMYPAYPFLALNASIALHEMLGWLGNPNPRTLVGKIPAQVKFAIVASFILGAIAVGALRTIGTVHGYQAPLQIYQALSKETPLTHASSVCTGKEWYRFPTSYFLPAGMRARFVKSEFRGLLPGQFSEAKQGFGLFPGTWLTPSGMNDRNIEDPGKYTDISRCDYLVDSRFPSTVSTTHEPDYIDDKSTWQIIHCEKFLDPSSTPTLSRLLWVPDHPLVPARYRRRWGEYCLLRRRKSA